MCVGAGRPGVKGTSCGVAGGAVNRSATLRTRSVAPPASSMRAVGAEGGIAPRQRSRLALTTTEREEISRQLARGESLRSISRRLGRAPSTLGREVARNGGRGITGRALKGAIPRP